MTSESNNIEKKEESADNSDIKSPPEPENTSSNESAENPETAAADDAQGKPQKKEAYKKNSDDRNDDSDSKGYDSRKQSYKQDFSHKSMRFKKKICRFCKEKDLKIDYKQYEILERFITDRGKILPRRVTGTCAKHQRAVAGAIKQARYIALIPYLEK